EEGCSCESTAPVDCVFDSLRIARGFRCTQGARYCRAGEWSACESVYEYEIATPINALITSPSECNPCNPDCYVTTDRPDGDDLTPENSDNATYDADRGGITIEGGTSSTRPLDDADGDGIPDIADDAPGDPAVGTSGLYHTLPFGGPSQTDPLEINARITTADIYFLMDTTGSMGGEIANLQAGLTSGTFIPGCPGGVVGAIECTIPNASFGVGHFEDYPVSPFGSDAFGDLPYTHDLDITDSLPLTQTAVNGLSTRNGVDWPESHTQALWSMVTGNGLFGFTDDRTGCPPETFGYPCFREDALPIVVLFTDADMHNGPRAAADYGNVAVGTAATFLADPPCVSRACSLDSFCCSSATWDGICTNTARTLPECGATPFGVSWTDTVAALNGANAKVIVVESSQGFLNGEADALSLANATGTLGAGGTSLVFSIPQDGSGLSTAVVDAVDELANATRFDISIRATDNPLTAFDETQLVESLAATGWGPGSCAGLAGAEAFQCSPGTLVDFVAEFRNDVVMPIATPQVFNFTIEFLVDGSVQDEIPVRIVVPAVEALFDPEARYLRTHNAAERCLIPPERPDWQDFAWEVLTPSDTAVRFEFRSADTEAGLDAAVPITVTVPSLPETGTLDVGELLVANGQINFRPFLRTSAVLTATADRREAPLLVRMDQIYNCVPME
ncbi:MAG: hypothetical protein AAF645_23780, partial [Myxococcota bacterium]